ncbi:hypothetical protein CHU92_05230 [Flavobacterium cyanobacteriorum]|uniref:Uncharacterized protein n=1 Tax=Flavobacterium cyanobacteriorum TaxID=2022802 RepID=A0A255ZA24_9FLAO|nr:hypothetical protein [Flavobacterium cyanobacteriorum]OYQ38407.1 hypothetical protein CHU92_05230 [Flavobacterium cyanobacteriorum]
MKTFLLSGFACIAMVATCFANNQKTFERVSREKEKALVEQCCTRTATQGREKRTATRCYTHKDQEIAKGRACALAQADADKAKERSYSLTVTNNGVEEGSGTP